MLSRIIAASVFSLILFVLNRIFALRRNIRVAKQTNLPYIIVPIYTAVAPWLVTRHLILPWLRKLPENWTYPWLDFLETFWSWNLRYEPFQRYGSDTILTVAPGGIIFHTCSAEVIAQVLSQQVIFQKPFKQYAVVSSFGPNLVASEGPAWRRQRKAIAPTFTEPTYRLVWQESLIQTQAMLQSWLSNQEIGSRTLRTLQEDVVRVSFNVINRAGFGVQLSWPSKTMDKDKALRLTVTNLFADGTVSDEVIPGHRMSYKDALLTANANLRVFFILPKWFLRSAPFRYTRKLWLSHSESSMYINELMAHKEQEQLNGTNDQSPMKADIMSLLIKAQSSHDIGSSEDSTADSSHTGLSRDEIIGNTFVLLGAGQETTGSTLYFAMLELALNMDWQKRMQEDLDHILGDSPPSSWGYNSCLGKLLGSSVSATMHETLRLYPPANIVPKVTQLGTEHILKQGDKEFIIHGNTRINCQVPSAHRNPNNWPCGPAPVGKSNDLDQFRPQRWLLNNCVIDSKPAESQDFVNPDHQTSPEDIKGEYNDAAIFKPPRGAYIPFSEGNRSCIGRRFSQVEIMAVLAVIFKSHSLELAVDDFASDEELENMDNRQKKEVWLKASARAKWLLQYGMEHSFTMQLKKGKVPFRVVRRGEERFL